MCSIVSFCNNSKLALRFAGNVVISHKIDEHVKLYACIYTVSDECKGHKERKILNSRIFVYCFVSVNSQLTPDTSIKQNKKKFSS